MAAPRNIVDILFRSAGRDGVITTFPIDVDLAGEVNLTSPVLPPLYPDLPRAVEKARRHLRENIIDLDRFDPAMPEEVEMLQLDVRDGLYRYLAQPWTGADRLYVLEFQGPWQYTMFGHTKHLPRRLAEHMNHATRHGFALMNAWASPPVGSAVDLERTILLVAGFMHRNSRNECFPQLSYPNALSIARAVFELHTDWSQQAVQTLAPVTYPDQRSAQLARIVRNACRLGPVPR